MKPRWRVAAVVVGLSFSLAGCSSNVVSNPTIAEPTPTVSGMAERLAGSLPEVFQKSLDTLNPSLVEREAIERAITAGRIDPADYEAAHLRFVQCMAQHGFHPAFRKTPNGYYIQLPYAPGDLEREASANQECSRDNAVIGYLYNLQQSNPDLLADQRLRAIQCLKKYGFINAEYTVDDFDRDSAADTFPFDKFNEQANNCLFQAGYAYFNVGQ